jgi:hypothetical protein
MGPPTTLDDALNRIAGLKFQLKRARETINRLERQNQRLAAGR